MDTLTIIVSMSIAGYFVTLVEYLLLRDIKKLRMRVRLLEAKLSKFPDKPEATPPMERTG